MARTIVRNQSRQPARRIVRNQSRQPVKPHGIQRALTNPGSKHRSAKGTQALKTVAQKKAAAGKTVTTTTNPPPVAPFLTPEQQEALNHIGATYQYNNAALDRAEPVDRANATLQVQANQKSHTANTAATNDNAAARGVFLSSIRDGDLNDIDATLAARNNIVTANLNSRLADLAASRTRLNTDYTSAQNLYNADAVANAQAQPPNLPTTTTTTTPGAGAQATAQKPAARQSQARQPRLGRPHLGSWGRTKSRTPGRAISTPKYQQGSGWPLGIGVPR